MRKLSHPIDFGALIESRLPQELVSLLRTAGEAASRRGCQAYIVGGVVRDLLLERPTKDIDVVVEVDALAIAEEIARHLEGKLIVHRRFGTAKLRSGDRSIDLATARSESYPQPGALPVVGPGSIESDLGRRDFSINAMAIFINPSNFGKLLDPHNGLEDLQKGIVRVLHDRSFIDDATRILRAIRYEQRLGFRLEESTEMLLRKDKSYLKTISGDRLRHELELILREKQPELALMRAYELGALGEIAPFLRGDEWLKEKFQSARRFYVAGVESVYLCLLVFRASPGGVEALSKHLNFPGKAVQAMRDTVALKARQKDMEAATLPSSVFEILKAYSLPALRACEVACDPREVREKLKLYLRKLRYVKSLLDGEDLKRMGISQGPEMGIVLHALHKARLDGFVKTRGDEESFVRRWLSDRETSLDGRAETR
ncbi:MAG: CCA tRNA nucleotidyltransferase [Chloroflexi bacterium]|nr:CCA tRNA nucleotidyltransferase [Chloroflexota bacterium]